MFLFLFLINASHVSCFAASTPSVVIFRSFLFTCTGNLAAGKNTTQSSTYEGGPGGQSEKAVDGNSDTEYDHGHCSHTNENNPSWWRVDLGSNNVPVFEVLIINRFSMNDSLKQRNLDYKITLGRF